MFTVHTSQSDRFSIQQNIHILVLTRTVWVTNFNHNFYYNPARWLQKIDFYTFLAARTVWPIRSVCKLLLKPFSYQLEKPYIVSQNFHQSRLVEIMSKNIRFLKKNTKFQCSLDLIKLRQFMAAFDRSNTCSLHRIYSHRFPHRKVHDRPIYIKRIILILIYSSVQRRFLSF